MKTQQMSLGSLNVQPVIMDAKQLNKETIAANVPKSSTPKIPLNESNYDNSFKT